jgi:hypothetical protein
MLTENIDSTRIDAYYLRHLGHHLCAAGKADELHRLLALEHHVGSSRVVNYWFTAHDYAGSLTGYLDDIDLARTECARTTDEALGADQTAVSFGMEIRYMLMAGAVASRANSITADVLGMTVSTGLWSPERALDHVHSLTSASERLKALNVLRPLLPLDQQDALNAEALDAATNIGDGQRGEALATLAAALPADLLDQAVAVADSISDAASRARALTGLAPHVAAERRKDVLTRALAAAADTKGSGPLISSSAQRATALVALAAQLPVDLLDRAVAVADSISDAASRARALTGLAPHVAAERRKDVLTRALAAAAAIFRWSVSLEPTGGPERATALTDLAPHLPDDLLDIALSSAIATHHEASRVDALIGLAPYLPDVLLTRMLTIAADFDADDVRRVLASVAPHLPVSLRPLAIEVAKTLKNDFTRGRALLALISLLPESLLAEAAHGAFLGGASEAEKYQEQELLKRLPHLRTGLYEQAMERAAAIVDADPRADYLARLAPYAPIDQRSTVLSQALAAVGASLGRGILSSAMPQILAVLGPQLPADLLVHALDMMTAISAESLRGEGLAVLAPYLHGDLIDRALSAAVAIHDDDARTRTLTLIAPYAPASQRLDAVARIVAAASGQQDAWHRVNALSGLATYTRPEQEHAIAADAVTAAGSIGDNASRSAALIELAPRLPADLIARVMDLATAITSESDRASALAGLAPYLPAELLPAAIARISEITAPWIRLEALPAFVPYLPADQRATVLAEMSTLSAALPSVMSPDIFDVDRIRLTPMYRAAPYLPAEDRDWVVGAAGDLADPNPRAWALTRLAPWMPADRQKTVLAQATAAVAEISERDAHIHALTELVPHLPLDLLPRAVTGVSGISIPGHRLQALVALAPQLTPTLLSQVVIVVLSVADQRSRATALAALAPYLPVGLLDDALTSVTAMTDENAKATALAGLIPHLTIDQRPAALTQALAAAKAARPAGRAAACTALALYLPADKQQLMLGEALTATAATDEQTRAQALSRLAPHLSGDLLSRAIAIATTITAEWERATALNSLVPQADAAQLARTIDASPESRVRLLTTAISARTRSGHTRESRTACAGLMRAGMTGADRRETLTFIGSAAPAIASIGGTAAANDCVQAIDAVYRWWA